MRHGSFKIICLVLWACVVVFSGFGDDETSSFETRILDSFNGDSEYTWKTDASKFVTKKDDASVLKLIYVDAWPMAAFGLNREGKEIKSLGLRGSFDRQGYNWVDLYPVKNGDEENPAEIPIPGRVKNFDVWVWGSNLKYDIEIFLRDYKGVVHSLKLGSIAYRGWKNLRVNVPSTIQQGKRILPAYAGLTFVKFRIWTRPEEKVDDFFIYFKQLQILTDVFESLFDGNELADPQNVDKIWAN